MADDNADGGSDYNEGNLSYVCAAWAPILGFAGIASAVVFASKFFPRTMFTDGNDHAVGIAGVCYVPWQDLIVPLFYVS